MNGRLLVTLVACGLLTASLAGCGSDSGGTADATTGKQLWTVVQEKLPGALLSVWGTSSTDVWTVGARDKTAQKPMALHHDGTAWTQLDTGATGDLWWVFGPDANTVWMVGSEGKILRYDRASKTFTALTSPTDATLYGIWGAGDGTLWAVGGYVGKDPVTKLPRQSVVVKVSGDKAELVTDLPPGIEPGAIFFKVWGSAANDVWVVGELGTVLRYDGTSWKLEILPNNPRLVTLHGSSANDMVVVGGQTGGVILERNNGGAWLDASPQYQSPFNGVFVRDGKAIASGMNTSVFQRTATGWTDLPIPPTEFDFHACWIDPAGSFWFAGGNISTDQTMNDGVLLRFEP